MSEPLRTAPVELPPGDADREALVERLLVAGLDHYFEGRYEQAVNVWTRVAFLERGHGRARAYIERARGAMAERQRQAEELLQRGIDAYHAGQLAAARDLLTRAVAEDGANEIALVFLQRLGRAEVGSLAPPPHAGTVREMPLPAPAAPPLGGPGLRGVPGARVNWVTTALASAGLAASILLAAQPIASWLGERPLAAPVVEPRTVEPLPIVRTSELTLARARALRASGQSRQALRLLEGIGVADPNRGEADRLRGELQRDLLGRPGSASP